MLYGRHCILDLYSDRVDSPWSLDSPCWTKLFKSFLVLIKVIFRCAEQLWCETEGSFHVLCDTNHAMYGWHDAYILLMRKLISRGACSLRLIWSVACGIGCAVPREGQWRGVCVVNINLQLTATWSLLIFQHVTAKRIATCQVQLAIRKHKASKGHCWIQALFLLGLLGYKTEPGSVRHVTGSCRSS